MCVCVCVYSRSKLCGKKERIYNNPFCENRNRRKILVARTDHGNLVSSVYCIHDNHTAYCIGIGSDPEFRSENGVALLIYEFIKFYKTMGLQTFDLEGGNIEPIEQTVEFYT